MVKHELTFKLCLFLAELLDGIFEFLTALVLSGYYDPKTGRYITSDPIGLKGGLNAYTYVGNDPLNWIDPKGEAAAAAVCFIPGIGPVSCAAAGAAAGAVLCAINPELCKKAIQGCIDRMFNEASDDTDKEPIFDDKIKD